MREIFVSFWSKIDLGLISALFFLNPESSDRHNGSNSRQPSRLCYEMVFVLLWGKPDHCASKKKFALNFFDPTFSRIRILENPSEPLCNFFANILQCSQNNATMKQINLSTRHNPTEFFFRLKKSKLKLEAQTTRCQFLSKILPPTVNFHTHSRIFRRSASSAITLPKYSTIFTRFQSLLYSLISAGAGLATEPPASLH